MKEKLNAPFLVLGRAGMDFYAEPPGTPAAEATQFFAALGGSAGNAAVALAKLGQPVSLITALSLDPVGQFVRNQLRHYGVGSDLVVTRASDARTSLAVVETTPQAPATIYRNNAVDLDLSVDDLKAIDWSHFGTLLVSGTGLNADPSRSATLSALAQAKAAGLTTVIDLDYRDYNWPDKDEAARIYRDACANCDIVIGNDVEFNVLQGDAAADLRAAGTRYVFKMGADGSRTFDGTAEFFTPIFKVDALKPTGAGDGFMGGFLASLAEGRPIAEAVRRGSAVAAIVVTRPGCAPALPNTDELESFLNAYSAV